MGSEKYVYIGVYFKVFMPKEKYETGGVACQKCDKKFYSGFPFCPQCGAKTEPVFAERLQDFGEFCERVSGDEDWFSTGNIDASDYYIVMANSSDQPGHLHVRNELEQTLPKEDYSGDWIALAEALDASGIRHEKFFGVLVYWM